MPDELGELQEHAEHGAEHHGLAPVTMTMAILAVLVAAITLLGHRAHTEEILKTSESADAWAQYQAKEIRRKSDDQFRKLLSVVAIRPGSESKAEGLAEEAEKESERYAEDKKEIQTEAVAAAADVKKEERRADKYDLAEVLLEAALVICSITLLTRKRIFWYMGIVLAVVGIVLGVGGLMIR
jgi:hypothetical protein